ncbi:T9SS type A sorting domain-containing protein [Pontibacter vulgaris]|uniref:T9SS type A sorting domain-containing protein n=1 Tax=Pontibacter vulgaris TaxID=2905679 RepID=UPI001FA7C984|nr:T9SS type A sorting domain-containing protein [Pontibacter vulgaris]
MKTVSQTFLSDSTTVEHFQRQVVKWALPGVYEISWKSCCRSVGSNFNNNSIGLFAVVNYSLSAPSSSPKFQDLPLLSFQAGQNISFSLNMEDPDGHEQVYALEVPYGLTDSVYQKMQATGFQVSSNGLLTWGTPVNGKWLVNVKLREKIGGDYTGAYILRDFIIEVAACELPAPNYTIVSKPCVGSSNGAITFNVVGGTAPFKYSLNDGNTYQTSPEFKGLPAGEYTGIVVDALGCVSKHVHIALDEAPLPQVALNLPAEVCLNAGPVTLAGSPNGGIYQGNGIQNGVFYPEVAGVGTHTIVYSYTDANGCSNTASATIVVLDALVADAGADAVVYYGYAPESCTTLAATASGGKAPYTYKWSTGATSQSLQVCPTVTTTYNLMVTDALGCTALSDVTVTVQDVRGDTTTTTPVNGNKPTVVIMCKDGKQKEVNEQNVAKELQRGAVLGPCNTTTSSASKISASSTSKSIAINNLDEAQGQITVYPNPVNHNGQLRINSNVADELKIELVDLTGKTVGVLYKGTIEANQELILGLGKYVKGKSVYMLKVTTQQDQFNYKLMVL